MTNGERKMKQLAAETLSWMRSVEDRVNPGVPRGATLDEIKAQMTPEERSSTDEILRAHGEEWFWRHWRVLQAQLWFIRSL